MLIGPAGSDGKLTYHHTFRPTERLCVILHNPGIIGNVIVHTGTTYYKLLALDWLVKVCSGYISWHALTVILFLNLMTALTHFPCRNNSRFNFSPYRKVSHITFDIFYLLTSYTWVYYSHTSPHVVHMRSACGFLFPRTICFFFCFVFCKILQFFFFHMMLKWSVLFTCSSCLIFSPCNL